MLTKVNDILLQPSIPNEVNEYEIDTLKQFIKPFKNNTAIIVYEFDYKKFYLEYLQNNVKMEIDFNSLSKEVKKYFFINKEFLKNYVSYRFCCLLRFLVGLFKSFLGNTFAFLTKIKKIWKK